MDLTTVILKTECIMMRNDWSNIGSAVLGQYAEDSVQDAKYYYGNGLCAPSDVYSNGMTTPSDAPKLDRGKI
eukprot:914213-Pyramimonas_sp.AAC.1